MNMIKKMLRILGFVLILSVIWSCGASKPVTVVERKPEEPRLDESFDPLMLQDEDITFPAETAYPNGAGEEVLPGLNNTAPGAEVNQLVDGFRIQIFASKDIERATLEKKQAEFQFLEDSVAVYIEFDSPMYKVRVGDFRNREDAEKLKRIARRKGYREAWIVKTKVNTHPTLPQITESEIENLQQ